MIALLAKLTACTILVWLLAQLAWRHGPHWAERALTGGLLLVLLAPWGGIVSVGSPASTTPVTIVAPEPVPLSIERRESASNDHVRVPATGPSANSNAPKAFAATARPWLIAAWLVGSLLISARVLLGLLLAFRAANAGTLVGEKHAPRVVESASACAPFLWSFGRAAVVLPMSHRNWSAEQRAHVVQHERCHWQRADGYRLLVGQVATTVFWWHPFVWMLARAQRAAIEASCDADVLRTGVDSNRYAQTLVNLAHARVNSVVPTVSDSRSLIGRVRRILQAAPYKRWTLVNRIAALLILVSVAGIGSVSFAHVGSANSNKFAALTGSRLTYEHFGRIPSSTLQIVAFYDGGQALGPSMELELINRSNGERTWLQFSQLPKFDVAIPAWEFSLESNVEPSGLVRINGVEPDGVIDGLAFGVMWRNSDGDYDSFRSVSQVPTRIPTEVCSWPLAVIDIPRAESMTEDQIWHLTSVRHAICGAELLPDGEYLYGRG